MLFFLLLLALLVPSLAQAEIKVIAAEATYTMGDGETPTFAEAMVLQKAKQLALEQAGTYVESYTKVQSYNLTTEEIQTIAGGVLQVEVLDKSRTLIGEGLRIYVKIRATVTTDKMEELAQRVKGKNVAEEYKKLQADYARLNKEIESWKQLIAKTPAGPERETASNQIRQREQEFSAVQKEEAMFFQRLVSGEDLVRQALDKKAEIDRLIQKIIDHGHVIEIGQATASPSSDSAAHLNVSVPVTLKVSPSLFPALSDAAHSLGGILGAPVGFMFTREVHDGEGWGGILDKHIIGSTYQSVTIGSLVRLSEDPSAEQYFLRQIGNLALEIRWLFSDGNQETCSLDSMAIRRLLLAKRVKQSKEEKSRPSLRIAFRPPLTLYLSDVENWRPDSVVLLFKEATFRVERRLAVQRAGKLTKVTSTFAVQEPDQREESENKCTIAVQNKEQGQEDQLEAIKKDMQQLKPVLQEYLRVIGKSQHKGD